MTRPVVGLTVTRIRHPEGADPGGSIIADECQVGESCARQEHWHRQHSHRQRRDVVRGCEGESDEADQRDEVAAVGLVDAVPGAGGWAPGSGPQRLAPPWGAGKKELFGWT